MSDLRTRQIEILSAQAQVKKETEEVIEIAPPPRAASIGLMMSLEEYRDHPFRLSLDFAVILQAMFSEVDQKVIFDNIKRTLHGR